MFVYAVNDPVKRTAIRRKSYSISILFHLLLDVSCGFHTVSSASVEQPEAQPLAG